MEEPADCHGGHAALDDDLVQRICSHVDTKCWQGLPEHQVALGVL